MSNPPRPMSDPRYPSMRNPGSPPDNTPSDGGTTYIGKSLLIKGEVSGLEPIHVEGRIEGSISLPGGQINVGQNAVVGSDVNAGEVIVRGKLHGKLTASNRVEIHSGGSMVGDVVAAKISIAEGASFQGSVDMSQPEHAIAAASGGRKVQS